MFDSLPVVHEPLFWAVAVPVVLLAGMSKSGFASGLTTLCTPMMALTVGVPKAAAIMLPLLMLMDVAGLQQLWRQRDPALVRLLVPFGLLGIALGTLMFGLLPATALAGIVGALTLAFLAQRLLFPPRADRPRASRWVGRLCGTLSGMTSFVVHAGSPPFMAYVLPLKLSPLAFGGTAAVFFAAINAAKVAPYAFLGLLDLRNLFTSVVLMPVAALGVWLGVKLLHLISPTWFYRVAYAGMFLSGSKLLWDGLRAL